MDTNSRISIDCENIEPMAKQVRKHKCYVASGAIAIGSLTRLLGANFQTISFSTAELWIYTE